MPGDVILKTTKPHRKFSVNSSEGNFLGDDEMKSCILRKALCLLAGLVLLTGCSVQTTRPLAPESGPSSMLPNEPVLDVPYLSQQDTLPTGCEATSAAMVLQYYGLDYSPEEVACLLPCQELYWRNGELYGPHPDEYFVGSPFSSTGYGCYAPVIARVLEQEFSDELTVSLEYGCTIQELYQTYVAQSIPVLIWVTIDLVEPEQGTSWRLADGSPFTWKKNEHCMVLIGRQGDRYLCQDPYESHGTLSLTGELLQLRFEQMGSQAVAVMPLRGNEAMKNE